MTAATLTLVDFLLACVAEDEAKARACAKLYPPPWEVSDRGHTAFVRADAPNFWTVTELEQNDLTDEWLSVHLDHIANWDPARVLAECKAKRRIVDDIVTQGYLDDLTTTDGLAFRVLRDLCLPYADRPGCHPDWRP